MNIKLTLYFKVGGESMNIKTWDKIEKGRQIFPQLNVKKSGVNKFHKFKYYELDDLLPPTRALCEKLMLTTYLNEEEEDKVKLEIIDREQGDDQEPVVFTKWVTVVSNSDVTKGMQEGGSVQKYAWRYLLQQLWEVSEADSIDASKINMNDKEEVSKERARELASELGRIVHESGGNNRSRDDLLKELNSQLKSKTITNAEFKAVKQLVDKV